MNRMPSEYGEIRTFDLRPKDISGSRVIMKEVTLVERIPELQQFSVFVEF
jgi:hypothetical protein